MIFFDKDANLPYYNKKITLDEINIEPFTEDCFETKQCSKIL